MIGYDLEGPRWCATREVSLRAERRLDDDLLGASPPQLAFLVRVFDRTIAFS